MTDISNSNIEDASVPDDSKRFRSEIEFPYSDLASAVELAHTIHSKAGSSAELDELAAWMGQTATGGTFRTRIGAARMFGLIETGQGRATLTKLGRESLDGAGDERGARVTAFLNVELFRVMYDQFKGSALPPAAALERQMEHLGVSPKQKERARQTFMKSANYAQFIDAATGRFVKPGIAHGAETTASKVISEPKIKETGGGSGGGGGDGDRPALHPFIEGLLKELPPAGKPWPEMKRKLWLSTAESIFRMIYPEEKEADLFS